MVLEAQVVKAARKRTLNDFAAYRAERRKATVGLDSLLIYISRGLCCTVALALEAQAQGSKQSKEPAELITEIKLNDMVIVCASHPHRRLYMLMMREFSMGVIGKVEGS